MLSGSISREVESLSVSRHFAERHPDINIVLLVCNSCNTGLFQSTCAVTDVDPAAMRGGAGTSTISGGRPLTYLLMISREP